MKLLKGTTNIGFISKDCIIIGVDSRITDVSHDPEIIISDMERKYFEFSSKANIVCTFMGLADDWDGMYQYVKEKEPTSVKEAVKFAQKYMDEYKAMHQDGYMFKYNKEYKEEVSFGALIAGYDEQEVFKLYRLHIADDKELKGDIATLGSGGWLAEQILMDEDYKNMTKKASVDLAYRALLEPTISDPYSGGKFILIHVRKNGYSIAETNALDVYYKYYDVQDINQRTLFLLYPGAQRDELLGDELIQSIWPNGEVTVEDSKQSHLCHVYAVHLVAQKRDFNFHRLVFLTNEEAERAYQCIPPPVQPKRSLKNRKDLRKLVRKYRPCGSGGHETLYVARGSKELLLQICNSIPNPID